MHPDSATLSSAVHVERAMPPTKLHIAFFPSLTQILKETLMMYQQLAASGVE